MANDDVSRPGDVEADTPERVAPTSRPVQRTWRCTTVLLTARVVDGVVCLLDLEEYRVQDRKLTIDAGIGQPNEPGQAEG